MVDAIEEEAPIQDRHADVAGTKTRWQENHGNLLVAFVGIVFAGGAAVLLYRQNKFVPVSFPEDRMIVAVGAEADPESVDPATAVTIRVIGAANEVGDIKIAIYDSESNFNDIEKALLGATLPIANGEAKWPIPAGQLPKAFAVAAYHDENRDDRLNRSMGLGVPTERYGFSNNARGLTGAPRYRDTVIKRPSAGKVVDVVIY